MRALIETLQESERIARSEFVGPGLTKKSWSGLAMLRPRGQGLYYSSRRAMSSFDSDDVAKSGDEEWAPPSGTSNEDSSIEEFFKEKEDINAIESFPIEAVWTCKLSDTRSGNTSGVLVRLPCAHRAEGLLDNHDNDNCDRQGEELEEESRLHNGNDEELTQASENCKFSTSWGKNSRHPSNQFMQETHSKHRQSTTPIHSPNHNDSQAHCSQDTAMHVNLER